MTEAHGRKGMPRPAWETEEFFDPLPGEESEPPEWRDVRHGLNSMDLLVDQKLGGEKENGEVMWIVTDQLLVQLSDPNTISVRWNMSEGPLGRLGLSNPRVRLTIWRW